MVFFILLAPTRLPVKVHRCAPESELVAPKYALVLSFCYGLPICLGVCFFSGLIFLAYACMYNESFFIWSLVSLSRTWRIKNMRKMKAVTTAIWKAKKLEKVLKVKSKRSRIQSACRSTTSMCLKRTCFPQKILVASIIFCTSMFPTFRLQINHIYVFEKNLLSSKDCYYLLLYNTSRMTCDDTWY